jgi:hypothetical protein
MKKKITIFAIDSSGCPRDLIGSIIDSKPSIFLDRLDNPEMSVGYSFAPDMALFQLAVTEGIYASPRERISVPDNLFEARKKGSGFNS